MATQLEELGDYNWNLVWWFSELLWTESMVILKAWKMVHPFLHILCNHFLSLDIQSHMVSLDRHSGMTYYPHHQYMLHTVGWPFPNYDCPMGFHGWWRPSIVRNHTITHKPLLIRLISLSSFMYMHLCTCAILLFAITIWWWGVIPEGYP